MNEPLAPASTGHRPTGSVVAAFPTLIGQFVLPGTASVDAAITEEIRRRMAETASRDFANVGGWHSAPDLLDWPGDAFVTLRSWISAGLSEMVSASARLPEARLPAGGLRGSFSISAWANVAARGHYHRTHNHPGSAWSGCYYVTGVPPDDNSAHAPPQSGGPLAGLLELQDPRPFTEMLDVPAAPYGQRMLIRPQPGLLVLFPGWLYHFVHPHAGDAPRISIAFNARWNPA
ncbi:MAG: hypothetical protein EBR86_12720 [Planctomycetia bacterium]|jgi:uncharacterized protein (TIGR02466 family)|nr:hypothetical protein [Planctomycetia bacterium]